MHGKSIMEFLDWIQLKEKHYNDDQNSVSRKLKLVVRRQQTVADQEQKFGAKANLLVQNYMLGLQLAPQGFTS